MVLAALLSHALPAAPVGFAVTLVLALWAAEERDLRRGSPDTADRHD